MKKSLFWLCALLFGIGASDWAMAQQGYRFGGEVMQQVGISPERLAELSRTQPYGTARSMAMGGAITSLGGDMASLFVNPAGLGMYRTNEFSVTPLVTVAGSENSAAEYRKNSATRFGLANIGFVINLYQGTGRVVSINMGFAYNRIADLNQRTSFAYDDLYRGAGRAPSLLHAMAGQLTVNDRWPDSSGFLGYYGRTAPDLWGSMMAYNSYLLNVYEDNLGPYWAADHIGDNASVGHFYDLESRGSIGEYALSLGLNISNKLYIGATFGLQSLSQRVNLYYGEDYRYLGLGGGSDPKGVAIDGAGNQLSEQADYMHYNQAMRLSGTGFNLKVGLTYRPIEAVRIGIAYHSPTWYSIEQSYGGQMASMSYNNLDEQYYPSDVNTDGTWSDVGPDSWELSTPSRLLAGLSYTFGSRAILSVDYQCDWYNAIRVDNTPFWLPEPELYERSAIKERFAASHTIRLGGEFKATQRWALRAGVGYTSSLVKEPELLQSSPLPEQVITASAGMGFALSRAITLDVAYQFVATRCSDYRLFYAAELQPTGALAMLDASQPVSTDYNRHNIALTLGFKF